jgi:hypothetical protein
MENTMILLTVITLIVGLVFIGLSLSMEIYSFLAGGALAVCLSIIVLLAYGVEDQKTEWHKSRIIELTERAQAQIENAK